MDDYILLKENGIEALKLLGNGASGRVYLSYNNELGIIAAKVMRLEKFDQREWDAAGKLNKPEFQCPFIMKYLRARAFQTDAVILMEYANAKSLDSIVKDKTKNLSSGAYRALSKQIHIKAENIMMHSSNGSIKVKIADFGLAKVISEAQMAVTALGTPFNMAPELLLGTSPGNNKVDMWSVGVVLFQLRTHEYPIQAGSILELTKKMASGRITRPTSIQDDQLWNLLTQLLEFDQNRRISAEQALQHPYFTSLQAQIEVSIEARQIALNAAIAFQNGDKQISKYDLDQTFTASTSEIKTFLNMNPEAEQQKILTIRLNQEQQNQQPIQITPQVQQLDLSISGFVNINSEQQLGNSILSPPKPNIQFHSTIQNPQIQQIQLQYPFQPQQELLINPGVQESYSRDVQQLAQQNQKQFNNQQQIQQQLQYPQIQNQFQQAQNLQQIQQFPPQQTPPIYQNNSGLPNLNTNIQPQPNSPNINQMQQSPLFLNNIQIQSGSSYAQQNASNQLSNQLNQQDLNSKQSGNNNLQSKLKEKVKEKEKEKQNDYADMTLIECEICHNKIPFSKYQQHIDEHNQSDQRRRDEQQQQRELEERRRKQKDEEEASKKYIEKIYREEREEIKRKKQEDEQNEAQNEKEKRNPKEKRNTNEKLKEKKDKEEERIRKEEQKKKQQEKDERRRKQEELDQRRKDDQEIRIRNENERRRIEEDKMEEQRIIKQGKQDLNNKISQISFIGCPFCNQQIEYQQFDFHIKTHDEDQQQLFQNILDLLPHLELNEKGEFENKDFKDLYCPICNTKTSNLDFHFSLSHKEDYPIFKNLLHHYELINNIQQNDQKREQNKQQNDKKSDQDLIYCHICKSTYPSANIIKHFQIHSDGQQFINNIKKIINAQQQNKQYEYISCPYCQSGQYSIEMNKHILSNHLERNIQYNSLINLLKYSQQQNSSSSSSYSLPPSSHLSSLQFVQSPLTTTPKQQQQQSISELQEQSHLQIILPTDITPAYFLKAPRAQISFPQNWIINHDDYQDTLVIFDKEIISGVYEFKAKANKSSHFLGYPCIKGDRKYGLNCKEIKSGDEVSVIVDLESVPHTFCVKINGGIQPFCVTRIPNRVKFTNDEWEFISLKELDKGPDLSRIEEKNRFRYE